MSNNNINNMIIVTDAYGRQKTILTNYLPRTPKFFEDGHLEQLDGLLTYQFSTLASDPATTHLVAGNNVIVRNKDRKLVMFTIIRTREERRDGKYVRTVFAENAAVDDLYNNICDGEELRAVSARNAATKVLEGTGWQVGNVDDAGLQNVNLNEYPTALAALHMIRDQYGLELEFTVSFIGTKVRDRYVHLVKKRGNVTGKRFTYGKDLTGITREVDRSDLATAIIPIGKADENGKRLTIEAFQNIFEEYVSPKGQKWVGDEKAMQLYGKDGKHLFKLLDLSGVDNEYELMKRAVEELRRTKQPRVTYEISCLLLEALSGYEHEKVRLGDTILVKDTMFDPVLAVKARVIAIYRSYTDPSKDYVVLGEFVPLVIDKNKQIQAIQDTINQNMTKWEQGGEVVLKSPNEPVKSKRTPDMLWLDTSAQPNVMRRWDAENNRWVNASATTPQEIGAEPPEGAQKKADKAEGTAIAEAAEDAAIKAKKAEDKAIEVAEEMDESVKIELKSYVEGLTEEVEAEVKKHADKKAEDAELNAKLFAEGYAEKEWHYGETPPEDLKQIWFDMSSTPNKIRKYNEKTKQWEAASPTSPKDIGAADIKEVMDEANKARDAAIQEAKTEANKAKDAAIAEAKELDKALKTEAERLSQQAQKEANEHTNSVTKEVEEALKKDSQDKANAAKEGALSEADKRILSARQEAERNAKTEAEKLAEAARKKAEENAAADAQAKANAARDQAKKDAATDAQNKANAAQKAATDRANAVKTEVENFAKDAGNITQGTLAAQRLHGVTISGKSAKIVDIDAANINTGLLDADRLRAGSIRADLLEFGGRARDVAENRPVTYTGGNGFSINGGMTARYNGAGSSRADKFPCTMSLDFGTTIGECVRIQWTSFYSNDARYAVRSYKLESSIDGTNWTTWADVTNNTNPIVSHSVVGSGQVRYVRLIVRAPQEGQTSVNVANFEVHSVQAGTIVTGDSILTGRIDATKVNVDNLNAGNIRSGTLHSDRIAANSINAEKIAANAVTADKVAANAITAQKIAANAITTDKLHVLAKSLVANTSLTGNDSTGWGVSKHATSTVRLRGSENMGDTLEHNFTTAEHEQPTLYESIPFEVDPNKTYKFNIGMFLDKNPRNSSQYFGLKSYDKNMKELPMQPLHPTTGALSGTPRTNPYFWSGKEVSGSWRYMEGFAVSAQSDANEAPQGRNIQSSYRMHPATKYLMMRFYSGYYPTVKNAAMTVLWWSPSVTSVDSGTIIAERITAGVLDANKVNVTNLKANNITSGTMTADRINGGTINAANTNIINLKAGNITSGTIDASKIGVTNMNAANITTGILNADRIGAKSISTYKLTVGDFTNYCVNPKFEGGSNAEWDGISVQAWNASGVPAGSPTPQLGRMTGRRDATCGELFTAEQDERFYVEFQSAHISGNNQFAIGMICYDKDKKAIGYPAVRRNAGGWSRTTGEFITPANTKYFKVWAQINAFENHGDWVFTDVVIRRMTDSKLLVNGSVIADKIAANAVVADKIAANAVNASKIAAGSVTAEKVAANAITADKIAAGSITTDKIAAAGITADKITSGILDANRVQVRNLNASVITAGTMSADRITGGTINANNTNIINLKAQNIASGTINADNVAISNGRVTLNKDGVTVTEANFLVKDAQTGLTHSTAPASNLISDHSFELLKADPNSDFWAQNYRKIDRTFIGNGFDGWAIVGDPYMADLYTGDADESVKLFGKKSIIVNTANYVWQDISVKANKKYSISFHCARPLGTPANEVGSPQVQVEYVKDRNVIASEVKNFAIPPNPVGTWVRYGFTVTANGGLNGRDNRIRLRFRTNNHWYLLIDGMQAVENDTPVAYNAEDSLFLMSNNRLSPVSMTLRNLMMQGNTRIEGGGLSIAGQNINGVGLEMSEILRVWGKPIEARNTHVSAHGYQCIASRPAGVDRMIWVGWHDQAGNAIYVYIGGSWKVAVRL